MLVAVVHGVKQNEANIAGFLFVVIGLLDNPIKQFSSQHLFRDQIVVSWLVKDIVETDDVLVLEFLQDGDFVLQSNLVLLGQFGFGDDFDGKRSG